MEGYINSAFSASSQGLARLLTRRGEEEGRDTVPPTTEPLDLDVDLDMDSFLDSLEKDSARREDGRQEQTYQNINTLRCNQIGNVRKRTLFMSL